jgi:nitrogen fixation NifU-like protein
MSDLRELYQEVIIDHNKNPRNCYKMGHWTHHAEGFNPLCGDQLKLYLDIGIKDNTINSISFEGKGCAISTASASLMTEFLLNKTAEQAKEIFQHFHNLMMNSEMLKNNINLAKLEVLMNVREFPSRVKCATLPWHTLNAAIHQKSESVSTE